MSDFPMDTNETATTDALPIASINSSPVNGLYADCLEAYAIAWSEFGKAESTAPELLADRTPVQTALIAARHEGMSAAYDMLLAIVDLHTAQQVAEALAALVLETPQLRGERQRKRFRRFHP